MNEFHCSARGVSAQTWLDVPKARRAKLSFPPIRILFPTVQYVRESVLGEQVSMFPQISTEGFTDARSLRAEGRCSVEGTSGRAQSFLEISSTSPGANGGVCSCIPRYTTHVRYVLLIANPLRQMILGIIRDKSTTSGNRSDSETEDEDDSVSGSKEKPIGWLYMGSHNFTPSAWGTLSGSAFNPTLNVRTLGWGSPG